MPATALRCRVCATEYAPLHLAVCERCLGPLDPVYDWLEVERTVSRESIEAGPPNLWRYGALLPVAVPPEPRLAPGLTPLVRARRLESELGVGELWLKLDTANPTHSFKDRVVAVAAAKAVELGLTTLACSSTGNLAGAVAARAAAEGLGAIVLCPADLEREKLAAAGAYGAQIFAVRGTYDDCSRLALELSFDLPWGFVNASLRSYYAEGSATLAYELSEQLGWRLPDVVACPIASGALYCKLHEGFLRLLALGLVSEPERVPRLIGGQAEGCAPVAEAFVNLSRVSAVRPNTLARSLAIGAPADGDLAVATASTTNGAIHAVPEDEIGEEMALLASSEGVFGETAAGVALGALRKAIVRGQVGKSDRVVLLVTGDGLKTPGPVEKSLRLIETDACPAAVKREVELAA